MIFHYIASDKDGKTIEDNGDFKDAAAVLEYIKSQGLTPIKIRQAKTLVSKFNKNLSSPINITDKIFLTKYLALMLRSGTDLFKAIDILMEDFKKPAMKALMLEIRENLEKGAPFYSTFEKYPRIFSPVFTNLIKAGETSGNLDRIFQDLSDSLEKKRELRQKIKSALTYPILLIIASFAILFLLVTFAIPRVSSMFMESGIELSAITSIIFAISGFFASYGLILVLIFILVLAGALAFFRLSPSGRLLFNRLIYRVPIVRDILKKTAYQSFATTFGSLMKAGLPILENLKITASAIAYDEMKEALNRIADDGLSKGLTLGDAFHREAVFPQAIRTLMTVGEQAGHTDEILITLADFYESEIDVSVKSIVSLVEPIMLLFIGIVIGGIALAVVLPVYQFVGQVGGI